MGKQVVKKTPPKAPKTDKLKTKSQDLKYHVLDKSAVEGFAKYVDISKDFALIPGKSGKIVEPTRDLTLKLVAYFDLSVETEKVSVNDVTKKNSRGNKIIFKMYTMKAIVRSPNGAFASAHGMASTEKSFTEGREDHDAMARAETRALKRAVETRLGLPIINQLIIHFFGGFNLGPKKLQELGLY